MKINRELFEKFFNKEKYCYAEPIVEALAELSHSMRASWMEHVFAKTIRVWVMAEGIELIPAEWTRRWRNLMHTPYAELSEEDKEKARIEARKMISVTLQYLTPKLHERVFNPSLLSEADDDL